MHILPSVETVRIECRGGRGNIVSGLPLEKRLKVVVSISCTQALDAYFKMIEQRALLRANKHGDNKFNLQDQIEMVLDQNTEASHNFIQAIVNISQICDLNIDYQQT